MKHKGISPILYAGLHPNTQMTIRNKTCFASAQLDIIARTICDVCGVKHSEFIGRPKTNELSDARKIFFYLCRIRLYSVTCRRLGEYAGGRDHSTITVAVLRCEELMAIDRDFRRMYVDCLVASTQQLKINGYDYKGSYKELTH